MALDWGIGLNQFLASHHFVSRILSLNPPKFVHTLSIKIYQSNQCVKMAVPRNIQLMWRVSKSGNGQGSRGGFFEARFG